MRARGCIAAAAIAILLGGCGGGAPAPPDTALPAPTPSPSPPPSPTPPPGGAPLSIGAQITPSEASRHCNRLPGDNAEATSLWVRWGEVPLVGGRYDWTAIDRQIDGLRACGLTVALHVQSRVEQADRTPPDLSRYIPYLEEMATRYRGRVSRYAIENEPSNETQWPGSPESYFEMLVAAYASIKRADPAAIVQDGGLSSGTVGYLQVDEIYRAGRYDEALALMDRVRAGLAGNADDPPPPATRAELDAIMAGESMARKRRWIELLRQHRDSLDAFQIHFYGDWDLLPDAMRWAARQGIDRPIEVWELSERRARGFAGDSEVADDMVKLMTIAAGEGSAYTLFYNYVDWVAPAGYFPGIIDAAGQPRPPIERAWQTLTEHITDAVRSSPVALGAGVWAYRFEVPSRGQIVYVLWSATPRNVTLPDAEQSPVRVIAMDGTETTGDARNLAIASSPTIVIAD